MTDQPREDTIAALLLRMQAAIPGTCDWGGCDNNALLARHDAERGWLPVCQWHAADSVSADLAPITALPFEAEWERLAALAALAPADPTADLRRAIVLMCNETVRPEPDVLERIQRIGYAALAASTTGGPAMTTPRADAIAALPERFDSLIAYVETWGNAGDGFIDTLYEVRAALAPADPTADLRAATLDVKRLADAMAAAYTGGAPLDRRYFLTAARAVAAKYRPVPDVAVLNLDRAAEYANKGDAAHAAVWIAEARAALAASTTEDEGRGDEPYNTAGSHEDWDL